jgi:hypothetical protein
VLIGIISKIKNYKKNRVGHFEFPSVILSPFSSFLLNPFKNPPFFLISCEAYNRA